MHRRSVLAVIAALLVSWRASGQRPYRVATFVLGPEKLWSARVAALRAALKELGYAEGRNLVLSSYWNEGGLQDLSQVAAQLLQAKPDVVVCGGARSAAAVQKHTRVTPIVLASGAGVVKSGLAKSFARPQGNVTGLDLQMEDLTPKHLELLKTVAPGASRLAVVNSSQYTFHEEAWSAARQAAKALRLRLIDVRVESADDVARIATVCAREGCQAMYVMTSPSVINWRTQIVEQAMRLRLPAMYPQPEFVRDGGLASYSANFEDLWRYAAGYVDRILKGAHPSELPIERPRKFDLYINLTTAKALGLSIPGELLARADQIVR